MASCTAPVRHRVIASAAACGLGGVCGCVDRVRLSSGRVVLGASWYLSGCCCGERGGKNLI